ncbi:MAG: undecaprenyl-phosphate glycosyltransferase, DPM1-like family [bacterium]|nr:undecaprenyl-phosphate glycosyltransferase, DPM1-like family [bacterium]
MPYRLSLVIPCYNEAESIPTLMPMLETTVADLVKLGHEVELILVDDGSRDGTFDLLKQATVGRPYMKVIRFARNFGQTAAMAAGFDLSTGDVVIPLDADLQNDPADIPALLAKLDEGYDVVSGWRRDRQDTFVTRKIPSWAANALISRVSGVKLHDYGCTLKAYRRNVISGVHLYGEMHRFIPIYAARQGARVTEIVVRHHARKYGTTKYGLGRVPKVFLDLVLVQFLWKYATKPMHLFGKLGLYSVLLSMGCFGWMIYLKFWQETNFARTPLPVLCVMFFLVGILSVMMGLVAELTMRTYYESSGASTYVVREVYRDGKLEKPKLVTA